MYEVLSLKFLCVPEFRNVNWGQGEEVQASCGAHVRSRCERLANHAAVRSNARFLGVRFHREVSMFSFFLSFHLMRIPI